MKKITMCEGSVVGAEIYGLGYACVIENNLKVI